MVGITIIHIHLETDQPCQNCYIEAWHDVLKLTFENTQTALTLHRETYHKGTPLPSDGVEVPMGLTSPEDILAVYRDISYIAQIVHIELHFQ